MGEAWASWYYSRFQCSKIRDWEREKCDLKKQQPKTDQEIREITSQCVG